MAVVALLLGAAGLAVPTRAQGQLRFQRGNPFDLDIGSDARPQSFALSDVNKDGLPDLVAVAVSGDGDDALAVLLNLGDGTFASPRFFVDEEEFALFAPAVVAVADVGSVSGASADGNMDVVIVDETDGVTVAFGDGTGAFEFSTDLGRFPVDAASGDLVGVAVEDFDGQNGPDLAVLDDDGAVFFLCNTGSSAFGICSTDTLTTGGSSAVAIAVGKFDDDEAADVVVLNQEDGNGDEPGRVALFLGDGGGNFSAARPATLPLAQPRANDLAVGLVNGDELNDVVVVFTEELGGDSVQVFVGQSSGRLQDAGLSISLAFSPLAVALADFDGDGIEDLVMPQEQEPFPGIVRGDGSSTFPNLEQPVSLGEARAVAVGDINADGRQDFVVLLLDGEQLRVAVNGGEGPTFTPAPPGSPTPTPAITTVPTVSLGRCEIQLGTVGPTPAPGEAEPIAVAAGDFDRDGNPDIVALDTATDRVVVLLTDPTLLRSRTEQCAIRDEDTDSYALDGDPAAIAVGDLNRDARLDLVVVGSDEVTVFLADPTREGGFIPQSPLAIESDPRSITIDDFNRDAIPDIATANFGADNVTLRYGLGDGTFPAAASATLAVSDPSFVLALDLNGDSRLDLAVASETNNRVSVFFQSGSGTFSSPTVVSLDGAPTALAAADLVRGGGRELLVAVRKSGGRGVLVSLRHSSGNAVSTLGTAVDTGPRPSAIGSADLNQEGNPADAVVASSIDDNVTFYFANADGSFTAPLEPVPVGREPVALAIADFELDGKNDIVVANRGAGTLTLLRSAVPPLTPTPTVTPTLGSPTVTPTPTETRIPDDTPVPTREPTSTPKEGAFALSGGGCAAVGATGNDRGLGLAVLGVAWWWGWRRRAAVPTRR